MDSHFIFLLSFSLFFEPLPHTSCELRDCDFFCNDRFRALDLFVVVIDVLATLVLLAASTGAADTISYLKFAKSGRVLRLARLLRLARVYVFASLPLSRFHVYTWTRSISLSLRTLIVVSNSAT